MTCAEPSSARRGAAEDSRSSAPSGWPELADDLLEEVEFGFLFDARSAALLDRLQRGRRSARQLVLRPARVGSASGELRGDRHAQDFARALVQARSLADAERNVARAALLERVDVRVPHAAARDAQLSGHAARRDVRGGGRAPDCTTAINAACRGASRSPPTTCRTSTETISTARSACPGSA